MALFSHNNYPNTMVEDSGKIITESFFCAAPSKNFRFHVAASACPWLAGQQAKGQGIRRV
jgi:hypothetical protein